MAGADYGEQIYLNGVLQQNVYRCGKGSVILMPKKCGVELRDGFTGEWIPSEPYIQDKWEAEFMEKGGGVIDGHTFTWRESRIGGNYVCDFYLREPDGDVWHGRTGYMQHDDAEYPSELQITT